MVHGQGREAGRWIYSYPLAPPQRADQRADTNSLPKARGQTAGFSALLAALTTILASRARLLAVWLSRASSLISRCLYENSRGALMRQRGHASARARGSTRKCETRSIATHAQVTRPQPISVWRLPAQPGGLRLARLWHARGSHRCPSTPSTPVTLPTLSNDFNFICCIKERCHCNPSLPDRSLIAPCELPASPSSLTKALWTYIHLGYLLTHLSLSDGPTHEMPTSTCVASVSSAVSCLHPPPSCYLLRQESLPLTP